MRKNARPLAWVSHNQFPPAALPSSVPVSRIAAFRYSRLSSVDIEAQGREMMDAKQRLGRPVMLAAGFRFLLFPAILCGLSLCPIFCGPGWAAGGSFFGPAFPMNAAYEAAAGDFNGDGLLDLAVAADNGLPMDGRILLSIVLADGEGAFTLANRYDALGSLVEEIAVDDFNGDGLADIAITRPPDSVAVLLGNGDGSLKSEQVHVAHDFGSGRAHLAVGKINADSYPDIVVSAYGGAAYVFLENNGDGTFRPPVPTSLLAESMSELIAADVNGDAHLDLVTILHRNETGVGVLLGNGDGTFQSDTFFETTNEPKSLAAGDLNNDSKQDLVLAGLTPAVMLGNGDGTFQSPLGVGTRSSTLVRLADLDADGALDIAAAGLYVLSVSKGRGNGAFENEILFDTGGDTSALVAGLFNRDDPYPDLVSISMDGVFLLPGLGDGSLDADRVYPAGAAATRLASANIDKDGFPDLAASPFHFVTTGIHLFKNRGDGTFIADAWPLPVPAMLELQMLADFNRDAHMDILATGPSATTLTVLPGAGNGTFLAPVSQDVGKAFAWPTRSDFDGDFVLDVTLPMDSSVLFLAGNGDGSFMIWSSVQDVAPLWDAVPADFNEDGALDLGVVQFDFLSYNSVLDVFAGDGAGGFEKRTSTVLSPMMYYWKTRTTDLDHDGHLDVVTLPQFGTAVEVLFGAGDGTFEGPYPILVDDPVYIGEEVENIAVADITGDGVLDILTGGYIRSFCGCTGFVAILPGTGTRSFDPPTFLHGFCRPAALAVDDFNRDGSLDFAAANAQWDNIRVLLSRTRQSGYHILRETIAGPIVARPPEIPVFFAAGLRVYAPSPLPAVFTDPEPVTLAGSPALIFYQDDDPAVARLAVTKNAPLLSVDIVSY